MDAKLASNEQAIELMLHALKEELFRLESERLDQSISVEDYAKAKSALDLLMKRVIGRK